MRSHTRRATFQQVEMNSAIVRGALHASGGSEECPFQISQGTITAVANKDKESADFTGEDAEVVGLAVEPLADDRFQVAEPPT